MIGAISLVLVQFAHRRQRLVVALRAAARPFDSGVRLRGERILFGHQAFSWMIAPAHPDHANASARAR